MRDLNSCVFYKVKMNIGFVNDQADYLWRIVWHIRNWITSKYDKQGISIDKEAGTWSNIKNGSKLWSKDKSTVYIESDQFVLMNKTTPEEIYWACKIVERGRSVNGLCPRNWVTEIGYEQKNKNSAEFSCMITYSDNPGFIGALDVEPNPTLPGLISNILRDSEMVCTIGSNKVSVFPEQLKAGDFPHFMELLKDENRELPYIYISPGFDKDTKEVKTLVNPYKLARAVCGNAVVYYSDDIGFNEETEYLCPSEFACSKGKIRIYFPNIKFEDSNDSYKHIIVFPSNIKEMGEDGVIKLFRRALVQSIFYYETYFRLDGVKQQRDFVGRKYRLEKLQEEFKKNYNELQDEQLEELIQAEEQKEDLERQLEEIKKQLDEKEVEVFNLSSQVEYMRASHEKNKDLEGVVAIRNNIGEYPQNQEKICWFIKKLYADRIDFSEDAMKSIKDCEIPCDKLWNVLTNLAIHMHKIMSQEKRIGDPIKEFKHLTGIDVSKREGPMTHKDTRLMKQFITEYNGVDIDIEPHITFPKEKQSIHFGFDVNSKKIIIGHCGEHLEVSSTRKMK